MLKDKLKEINLITKKDQINRRTDLVIAKHPEIMEEINQYCGEHAETLREKIYRIKNDIVDQPKCACGLKNAVFIDGKGEFSKYCREMCSYARQEALQIQRSTLCQRYGSDHQSKIPQFKEKTEQTNMIKFGGKAPICDPTIKKQIQDNYTKNIIDNGYGYIHEKTKTTSMEKYGVENFNQLHLSSDTLSKLQNVDWLYTQHITNKRSLSDISRELETSVSTVKNAFIKNNIEIEIRSYGSSKSSKEKEIITHIEQNYTGIILPNNRSTIGNMELDILLPEINLAIEYNGTYWHTEINGGKDKNYHYIKFKRCQELGIQLLQICDSEWDKNPDVVKSRINNYLGLSKPIYAKHTVAKQIQNIDAIKFLNENHIQGYANSSICIGLYYKDELYSVMSFAKSRFNKAYEYEILRFCSKCDVNIVGGASKLLKFFEKKFNPKSLISYCDLRWGTGKVYPKMGLSLLNYSKPDYKYILLNNPKILFNRMQFQKHKLKDKLEHFDPNLTEWENMQNNGYDRIWDCGNAVYIKNYT